MDSFCHIKILIWVVLNVFERSQIWQMICLTCALKLELEKIQQFFLFTENN